jgi:predicted alpha/beta superfamily hydrolase
MPSHPPVTIPGSEVRLLPSSHVDQEYRLSIALPPGYDAEAEQRYPVLYLLDGDLAFPMVVSTLRGLLLGAEAPRLIIVGIGYPTDVLADWFVHRTRDYTPTDGENLGKQMRQAFPGLPEQIPGGGAGAFLSFIRDELMPFVHQSYRADPDDRVFMGDSLGGLFGLYTLFHRPDTFGRYIVGSPSIWWDSAVTFEYERAFAQRSKELAARVFMSVGSLEEPGPNDESAAAKMVSNVRELDRILNARKYAGLELTTHVFDDETHLSVIPATLCRGLRVVFV